MIGSFVARHGHVMQTAIVLAVGVAGWGADGVARWATDPSFRWRPVAWASAQRALAAGLAGIAAWVVMRAGGGWNGLARDGVAAAAIWVGLVMAIADLKAGLLPDSLTAALTVLGLGWGALGGFRGAGIEGALLGGGLFLGLNAVLRWGWVRATGQPCMGLGDVKAALPAGMFAGLSGMGVMMLVLGGCMALFAKVWQAAGGADGSAPRGPAQFVALVVVLWLS